MSAVAARQPVAVGLDARGTDLASHGWEVSSGLDLCQVAQRFAGEGASAFVVTEIARDGTLEGPSISQLSAVLGAVGATGVDLSDVICDADRCPATHGKYLVYRDTDHLTATFSTALAPYLAAKLKPLLAAR